MRIVRRAQSIVLPPLMEPPKRVTKVSAPMVKLERVTDTTGSKNMPNIESNEGVLKENCVSKTVLVQGVLQSVDLKFEKVFRNIFLT